MEMKTRVFCVVFFSIIYQKTLAELLVERYLSSTDENHLCLSTADEQTAVDIMAQCVNRCLEIRDACMKLTVIESSGLCLISANVTTQLCNAAISKSFIVRPDLIPLQITTGEPGVNIALGKTISQNTQHHADYYADNAVDGLTEGVEQRRYCGPNSQQAFITIDLESVYAVQYVKIWGYLAYQISDTEVTIATTLEGLDLNEALCGVRVGEPASLQDTITCSSVMSARYVKVFRSSTHNHFCVYEIEVFSA